MNVLSEVIGDYEALGSGALDKHSLEINNLWTSIDLLQLLSGEFFTAVP